MPSELLLTDPEDIMLILAWWKLRECGEKAFMAQMDGDPAIRRVGKRERLTSLVDIPEKGVIIKEEKVAI